jgi:hypothetical protein
VPLGVDTALAGSTLDGITIDASIAGTNTVEDPQVYGRGVVFLGVRHCRSHRVVNRPRAHGRRVPTTRRSPSLLMRALRLATRSA